MNFSEPFIRRPVMTTVLTLSAILFGILSHFRLPVNDLPAVDYPVIQVQADYPGASPETVANNIATPLERQFMQINGLELVTSKSTQGHTSITLQFALSKCIDAAATDLQTAISQATGSLPVDLPSPPTFSKTNPNDQPIMYIALTSDSVTRGQLYDYGSTQIGQRISILPGVSRVNVFGTKSAIRIKADPSAMWARGISVDDLSTAIKNSTRALLPQISAELPGSVRITPLYDRSRGIVNSVNDVQATLMIAFVLVVLVIFLFLGRATDTLIPTVALPISLLLTFVVMQVFGYSLDNLSLMALTLAIGFLVDDAIVFLENTVRRMEQGERAMEATVHSAKEISFTILSMTISLA